MSRLTCRGRWVAVVAGLMPALAAAQSFDASQVQATMTGPSQLSEPALVSISGQVWMAYVDDDPTLGVYVRHSTDAGRTFGAPVAVIAAPRVPSSVREIALARDPVGGALYAVWMDGGEMRGARSDDDGATWSTDGSLGFGCAQRSVSMVAYGGVVHIGCLDNSTSEIVVMTTAVPGGAPGKTVIDSSSMGVDTALALDPLTAELVVAWEDLSTVGDIWVTRGSPGSFSPSVRVVEEIIPEQQRAPSVAVASDGTIHVAWIGWGGLDDEVFWSQSTDGGLTWSPEQRISTTGGHDSVTLAVDELDVVHFSFVYLNVWYGHLDGSITRTPVSADDQTEVCSIASMTVPPQSEPVLAYWCFDGTDTWTLRTQHFTRGALTLANDLSTTPAGVCSDVRTVSRPGTIGALSVRLVPVAPALTVYADPACTIPADRISILNGRSSADFYFRGTVVTGLPLEAHAPLHAGDITTYEITVGPPLLTWLTGPQSVVAGDCGGPLTLGLEDAAGNTATAAGDQPVVLFADRGDVQLYGGSDCSAGSELTGLTFMTGESERDVWMRSTVAGPVAVTARDEVGSLGQDTQSHDIVPGPARLGLAADDGLAEACSTERITLSLADAWGNAIAGTEAVTVTASSEAGIPVIASASFGTPAGTTVSGPLSAGTGELFVGLQAAGEVRLAATMPGVPPPADVLVAFTAVAGCVPGGAAPVIIESANRSAAVGIPYVFDSDRRVAATGDPPILWSATVAPAGLRVDRYTGLVTWVPTAEGSQTVTLVATNDSGQDDYTFDVVVAASSAGPPTAVIRAATTAGSAPFDLVADGRLSRDASDNPVVTHAWDVGDGSPVQVGPDLSHRFATPGSYVVRLTVTDAFGAGDVDSVVVDVLEAGVKPPAARIVASATQGQDQLEVELRCDCLRGDAPIESWAWQLGGGASASVPELVHTFGPGAWTVRLTVVDGNGLAASDETTIIVGSAGVGLPPEVSIGALPGAGVAPLTVDFIAVFGDADGEVVGWAWDFGGGDTTDELTPRRIFDAPGLYLARFTAEDDSGLTAEAEVEVRVTDAAGRLPPDILSTPVLVGSVGDAWRYDADGRPSARGSRPLTWTLGKTVGTDTVGVPAGMTVDGATGELTWTPEAPGTELVVLVATNPAGTAVQEFEVEVTGEEPVPEETGCGCAAGTRSSGSPAALGLLLVLAIGIAPRRRR